LEKKRKIPADVDLNSRIKQEEFIKKPKLVLTKLIEKKSEPTKNKDPCLLKKKKIDSDVEPSEDD
jgi:hypothetical protein